MRRFRRSIALGFCAVALTGCAQRQSQNVYRYDEVGKSVAVSFGTIVSVRQIDVTGQNTGGGALVGGATGAIAGSQIGNGAGSALAAIGIGLVGAAIGAAVEQSAADRQGLEYVVVLESGVVTTVIQDIGKNDTPINVGDRVIVQNSGGYQRVLPAAALPTQINRPQGITIIDPPKPVKP